MNLDDYVSAMTVGMARAPDTRPAGFAVLEKGFELDEPCRPEVRSLAARGADGRLIGYRAWVTGLAGSLRAGTGVMPSNRHGLAPHLAEAFYGGNTRVLYVGARAYVLEVVRSRSYAMSSADFVAWARSQPASDAAFLRVAAFVSDSNILNGRKAVPTGEVGDYLISPAGEPVFEMFASELVREVQLAVRNSGRTLITPDNGWFCSPPELERSFGGIEHDDQLELTGDVTAADLQAIFDAQACRDAVWKAVRSKLAEMQLATELADVPYDELAMVHRVLLGEMQVVCRDRGVEVARPTALVDRLGTHVDHMSETDRSEFLPAREHIMLAANPHAWECWCFRDIGGYASNDDRPELAATIREFLESLDAIADLAHRMRSEFAEAFELAAWILRVDDAAELLSPEHRAAHLKLVSERAREALEARLPLCDDFAAVGYSVHELRALLACDMASVFGGMGSWNDEVPPEPLAAEHEALSARLFASIERLRTSII